MEEDLVDTSADKVSRDKVVYVSKEMRTAKDLGPSDVCLELIAVSGEVWMIQVMVVLCRRVLELLVMPADEWALSAVV